MIYIINMEADAKATLRKQYAQVNMWGIKGLHLKNKTKKNQKHPPPKKKLEEAFTLFLVV